MSRNLEKEYKEMMEEEMPDLWGRIEAGLEPKQTGLQKKSLWKKYGPWGMAAVAACLCLAVIVPVMLNNGVNFSNEADDMQNMAIAPQNYGAGELNAGMAGEAAAEAENMQYDGSSAEVNDGLCVIRGVVTDVSEVQDITAYTVEIVETENEDFSAGDTVVLYDSGFMTEELLTGETYRLSVIIAADSEDSSEYWIYDAIPE